MRSLSLRTRVAVVSGLVAALVAVTLGIAYAALLEVAGTRQLDETISTLHVEVADGALSPATPAPLSPPPAPNTDPHSTSSAAPDGQSASPRTPAAEPNPDSRAPAEVRDPADPALGPGGPFAVVAQVEGAPGMLVQLNPDRASVNSAVTRSQLIGLGIGIAGVVLAAGLGWLLAGVVARPLRRLATATREIDTLDALPPLSGRGAREAEELSDAITRMLARLETAHAETRAALASARDFAAVCAHELRTPLTAIRTDLQVLAGDDLPADQRPLVLADVLAAESQIEHTLADLERLAVGELTTNTAFESFDLCDVVDRAVHDAARAYPGVEVTLSGCDPVELTGLPGGILLVITNAVANAVHHGEATRVVVAATADDNEVELIIDDNGTGIAKSVAPNAFDRFVKRPGSPGSGLGLALVRQQAELHGGTAELGPSPLGGGRLRIRLPRVQAPVRTDA
ncbi:sensor histidine kinase [Nocardia camponoti]|uniref:histidine kinase n=1 Tax=Nocardia camponoti TaxID=1616106 RepID=A0A917VBY8_9NOCA|nr:HAMP domain-containing sensor histidine kinase [Nocardia camponoti]GGK62787.1 hypothetical protein GCM10011591_38770 [Nocardia camponoti]